MAMMTHHGGSGTAVNKNATNNNNSSSSGRLSATDEQSVFVQNNAIFHNIGDDDL
jgi:hypothetical protein